MLQDLNHLADRLSALAAYATQLKSERSALLSRIKTLEGECASLREQLDKQQADYTSMAEISVRHQADVDAARKQAEQVQEALFVELVQHQDEAQKLRDQLELSLGHNQELRQVAEQARDQVTAVLQRLPGHIEQE
ncbi:hypothetical protein E4695_06750 [Alcaligenaceae bacterium 429]|uniref:hypothetical protein n=1 Tax=Paenalcaligenes sp. Me52 TaxID=3392038 RepID=UPI0010930770|nr:hypothetical protein E4695_06750 [Alcaligenaceae bacterium 429]